MKRTKPVKKMLAALSVFLLLLFCTACGPQAQTVPEASSSSAAAPEPAETDDIVSDFVFGDDGYAYAPAPFGSTREEVEAAIGREMDEQGSNPHTEPFEYMSYITPNQDVQLSGPSLKSRVDAQFTDEDGLFAITFNSAVLAEQRADFVETCRTNFTALFGEPTRDETSETNLTTLSWEDEESGTVFQVSVMGESTANSGEKICRVALGAFEKWRYVEAGVGEWTGEG